MKNNFFSFLFLLVSNLAFGQIEWVGNFKFSEYGTDIIRTSRNQQIIAHGDGFTVFDTMGNIVYNQSLGSYSHSEIVELHDSTILVFATFFECDLVIGEVIRFDKNWNMDWKSIDLYNVEKANNFSDNSIILGGEGIVRMDTNGVVIWTTLFSWPNTIVRDMTVSLDDLLAVATNNGVAIIGIDGIIDTTFENLKFERIEIMENGNYLAQAEDTLFVLSPDFMILNSLTQQGIVDFDHNESEILLLTSDPKIFILNNSLDAILNFQPNVQNQIFQCVGSSGNGLLLGGNEAFGNGENLNYASFIKEYSMTGESLITAEDVGVISLTSDGPPTVSLDSWAPYAVNHHDIKITVKNFGNSVVNDLNLNLDFGILEIYEVCLWDQRAYKHFGNLNLLPGETMELSWGNQFIFYKVPPPDTIHFCSWTSLPNHHLETNNDNDVSCTEVLVAAHEPLPISYHHAFNAVADVLYLEMQSPLVQEKTAAHIFNAAGQLVYKTAITEQQQTLELQALPDGAYFLQIVSGGRVGWGKFAKY